TLLEVSLGDKLVETASHEELRRRHVCRRARVVPRTRAFLRLTRFETRHPAVLYETPRDDILRQPVANAGSLIAARRQREDASSEKQELAQIAVRHFVSGCIEVHVARAVLQPAERVTHLLLDGVWEVRSAIESQP